MKKYKWSKAQREKFRATLAAKKAGGGGGGSGMTCQPKAFPIKDSPYRESAPAPAPNLDILAQLIIAVARNVGK